jgi:hypothetical protein
MQTNDSSQLEVGVTSVHRLDARMDRPAFLYQSGIPRFIAPSNRTYGSPCSRRHSSTRAQIARLAASPPTISSIHGSSKVTPKWNALSWMGWPFVLMSSTSRLSGWRTDQ